MLRSHLTIALVLAASQWLFVGCSSSAASNSNDSSSDSSTKLPPTKQNKSDISPEFFGIPYPKAKMATEKMNALFKPVNDACLAGTGNPLNHEMECECPAVEGESPKVFSITERKCISLKEGFKMPDDRSFKDCHNIGFSKIFAEEGISGFRSCLSEPAKTILGNLPGKKSLTGGSTSYYFNLTNPENMDNSAKLAKMLDDSFDDGDASLSFLKMAAPTTGFTRYKIYAGAAVPGTPHIFGENNILDGVLFDNLNRTLGNSEVFSVFQSKMLYEPDLNQLKYLMAPEGVYPPPELYPDYKGENRVLWTLSEARHVFVEREFKPMEISPLTGKDCTKVCRIFGMPFFIGDKEATLQVIQEKIYSGGVLMMDNIWAYDENLVPQGALVLGVNGLPMFYIEMNFAKKDGGIQASYDLYDRKFDRIGSQKTMIEENLGELEQGMQGLATIDQVDAGQGVLLCEQLRPSGQDWLFRGPYPFSAQDGKGSVYGWYENSGGSPFRMFAGVHEYLFDSRGSDYFSPSSYHGLAVAEVIRGSFGGAKIAPMGYCLYKNQSLPAIANNSTFSGPYAEQRVKVMNSSFTIYGQSEKSCQQRAKFSFGKAAGKILSVSSAGNGSLDHPPACPQTSAGHTSIVVAAADNASSDAPSLSSYSNRGENYADIAADPFSMDRELEGTSFAAPRVSSVAAKIAYTYDHLLPQDIRLAILTTAHIPANKLPVRTGGVLRGDRAMAMASCLHIDAEIGRQQGKMAPITKEQARRCLATVAGFGDDKAKAQIDFLGTRPLIFQ